MLGTRFKCPETNKIMMVRAYIASNNNEILAEDNKGRLKTYSKSTVLNNKIPGIKYHPVLHTWGVNWPPR